MRVSLHTTAVVNIRVDILVVGRSMVDKIRQPGLFQGSSYAIFVIYIDPESTRMHAIFDDLEPCKMSARRLRLPVS